MWAKQWKFYFLTKETWNLTWMCFIEELFFYKPYRKSYNLEWNINYAQVSLKCYKIKAAMSSVTWTYSVGVELLPKINRYVWWDLESMFLLNSKSMPQFHWKWFWKWKHWKRVYSYGLDNERFIMVEEIS
jgi:hypothetical protein